MALSDLSKCDYINSIPADMLLASMISNENNIGKLNMIEVADTNVNYFDCGAMPPTVDQILRLIIGFNSCDQPGLRVAFYEDACSNEYLNCDNNSQDLASVLFKMIGKSANGEAFLRINLESL